jgi:hypothetical protein
MKRGVPLAFALVCGLAVVGRAENRVLHEFPRGTTVAVVGEITSPPKGVLNEHKMQVAVGPSRTEYTLHFGDAIITGPYGHKLDEDGLDDKMWIRAEGKVMEDPRRIEVSRIQVIGNVPASLKRTVFHRPGLERGYVSQVAGVRETFPRVPEPRFEAAPVALVGWVKDDTGSFQRTRSIQVVSAGNEWTVHVPEEAFVVDETGKAISIHEVHDGQWIRATGWQTDDLRVRVTHIQNIGQEAAFQRSGFFRKDAPLGYVDRLTAEESRLPVRPSGPRTRVTGTVTGLRDTFGFFTIRDDDGQFHRVSGRSSVFWLNERPLHLNDIRLGERVTVEDWGSRR